MHHECKLLVDDRQIHHHTTHASCRGWRTSWTLVGAGCMHAETNCGCTHKGTNPRNLPLCYIAILYLLLPSIWLEYIYISIIMINLQAIKQSLIHHIYINRTPQVQCTTQITIDIYAESGTVGRLVLLMTWLIWEKSNMTMPTIYSEFSSGASGQSAGGIEHWSVTPVHPRAVIAWHVCTITYNKNTRTLR